jgi:hypothetical protein
LQPYASTLYKLHANWMLRDASTLHELDIMSTDKLEETRMYGKPSSIRSDRNSERDLNNHATEGSVKRHCEQPV